MTAVSATGGTLQLPLPLFITPLWAAAQTYAKRGWRVLPLHSVRGGRCSCGSPECSSVAKHPRTGHGRNDATTDLDQIERWWQTWPDANIGLATGPESNLVVLDFDSAAAFDALHEA